MKLIDCVAKTLTGTSTDLGKLQKIFYVLLRKMFETK